MDRLDMCEAIQTHKVSFELNPTNEWESFPPQLLDMDDVDTLLFSALE